jgi:hypothetical protein
MVADEVTMSMTVHIKAKVCQDKETREPEIRPPKRVRNPRVKDDTIDRPKEKLWNMESRVREYFEDSPPTRDQMPTPDTIVARNIIIAVIVVAMLFVLFLSAR